MSGGELEALGACAAVLLELLSQIRCRGWAEFRCGSVLLGRERGGCFAQVAGGRDAIGDLEDASPQASASTGAPLDR